MDPETWAKVQQQLAKDAAEYATKGTGKVGRQYLLSGLIKCGVCGGSFTIGSHFQGVRRYRCGTHASRGKIVCANKVNVPQEALEIKVRHVFDVLAKDPAQLEALVANHNGKIDEFNAGHLAAVTRLSTSLTKAQGELSNVVQAIKDAGPLKSLVAEATRLESEVDGLEEQIAKSKAEIQPRLLPRPSALTDYTHGRATIWTGDFAPDRALLESVLEKIRVHPDGTLVIQFLGAGLFGAVGSWTVHDPERSFQESIENQRTLFRMTSGLPGTVTVQDHGGRLVITSSPQKSETPASSEGSGGLVSGGSLGQDSEKTVCVPSGI